MQAFLYNIQQFFSRLSLGQRVALGMMLLGTLAILGSVAYWTGRPDYALLFGGLEPADANRVVESLQEQSVSYQLRESGTAVYVPREEVYELRLHFAGEGIISDGPAGYELFDEGTLGMTDFMQKLNMKRALEGELGRTISSIRQVELCRVHLVMPERSPFRQDQTRPSASVVLQVVSGAQLTPSQIEGINALVAGAVEGLVPAEVTILDARGNMLSDPDAGNPDLSAGSNQLRMQQAVETRLTEKGQSMLDQVLGPGNAIVRAAVSLDFTRLVSESDVIDPESATVISEERLEEGGEGSALNANSSVRNYDLSRTRERSEKSLGDIADLSISVILNYKKVVVESPDSLGGGEPEVTFEPYAPAELTEIQALVKNAVGFQEERGDRFAIYQTQFDSSDDTEMAAALHRQRRQEQVRLYIRYGLMALALVLATLLIRSATKRMSTIVQEEGALLGGTRPVEQLAGATQGGTGQLPEGAEALELLTFPQREEPESMDDTYASKPSTEAEASLSLAPDGSDSPTQPSSLEEFVPSRPVRAEPRVGFSPAPGGRSEPAHERPKPRPTFNELRKVETSQLTNVLQNEHPQTAALILAQLDPRRAADVISSLSPDVQNAITYRLATMGETSPELLHDLADVIRSLFGAELSGTGGVKTVAEILNNTSRSAEAAIMEAIRERDAELAQSIKDLMFVFDDLVHVSDRDMQRILKGVEQRDLALALKAVSEELKAKILGNMSERAAEILQEELELMGPVRIGEVEEAQRNITEIVRELKEQDEISLSRTNEDVMLE